MTHKNIIKILAGASKILRNSTAIIKNSSANFIEKNVVKEKYVTREEHEQLKNLVLKLQQEASSNKP